MWKRTTVNWWKVLGANWTMSISFRNLFIVLCPIRFNNDIQVDLWLWVKYVIDFFFLSKSLAWKNRFMNFSLTPEYCHMIMQTYQQLYFQAFKSNFLTNNARWTSVCGSVFKWDVIDEKSALSTSSSFTQCTLYLTHHGKKASRRRDLFIRSVVMVDFSE